MNGWDYIRLRDYQESDQDIQGLTYNNDSTEAYLKIDQTTGSTTFISENGKWYLSDYPVYTGIPHNLAQNLAR